jgi:hypothetical protein
MADKDWLRISSRLITAMTGERNSGSIASIQARLRALGDKVFKELQDAADKDLNGNGDKDNLSLMMKPVFASLGIDNPKIQNKRIADLKKVLKEQRDGARKRGEETRAPSAAAEGNSSNNNFGSVLRTGARATQKKSNKKGASAAPPQKTGGLSAAQRRAELNNAAAELRRLEGATRNAERAAREAAAAKYKRNTNALAAAAAASRLAAAVTPRAPGPAAAPPKPRATAAREAAPHRLADFLSAQSPLAAAAPPGDPKAMWGSFAARHTAKPAPMQLAALEGAVETNADLARRVEERLLKQRMTQENMANSAFYNNIIRKRNKWNTFGSSRRTKRRSRTSRRRL